MFNNFTHLSFESQTIWLIIGLLGQGLFFMRFLVQWLATERAKKSVVPDLFWYFSLGGGAVLLAYAIHRQDPVFILGQGLGLLIYLRNIHFVKKAKNASPS
ncbi:MAG: lipid-A-disaccharide synthase N-terminal domain-containing protein [Alphaproteobacteria bacterium]|nr:lipid-A-disaccharide synthase N-terminal domain-containing protein [Alphaproteobacteria bacterium]